MTSSERPGGTVSDSISVTKPYLYGWSTWASIPLLIGAPEVLCASQVAEIWPWRKRILQELLGIVNELGTGGSGLGVRERSRIPNPSPQSRAPHPSSVDVPIHLPDEALVILRRVEIVMTAGSSTATVTRSASWAASTAPAPCRVAAAPVASSGKTA